MTTALVWAILLLCVGLLIVVAELFVFSGGLLGVLAALSLLGSVVLAFTVNARTGVVFLLVVAVAVPVIVFYGLQIWPQTPLGRRMILAKPRQEEFDPTSDRDRQLGALVGQVGRTITPLRPAGMTDFDGRRIDTQAEGLAIDSGERVRVIGVRGRTVVVRKLEPQDGDGSSGGDDASDSLT